jgi:KDO2-lipid IV(A) lauroyltransferase
MRRLIQNQIEYFLFRCLLLFARSLSFRATHRVGTLLGSLAFATGFRKRVTLDNLGHAFPESTPEEIRTIAHGAYENYAISLVHMLWASGQSESMLKSKINPTSLDTFRAIVDRGKGAVLLSAHFGSWELIPHSVRLFLEHPLVMIVQRQRNGRIDAVVDSIRKQHGNSTVPMGPSSRGLLTALREKKIVLILGDQSGPKESPFINFFERPAATHRGAAALCLKTDAPLIFLILIRVENGTFDLHYEEVDRSGLERYTEENVTELTRRHTALLEEQIRRHPEQWLWMHKRWKHTEYYRKRNETNEGAIPVESSDGERV